jgi:hypothetical protein
MSGGPITMLLMDPEVTTELKITDAQKRQLMDIGTAMQSDMGQAYQDSGGDQDKMQKAIQDLMEKGSAKLLAVLNADQNKRLQEIYVQDNGIGAVVDKGVQKELAFKQEQTKKVADLQAGMMKAMQGLGQRLRNQEIDFQGFQDATAKNQKTMKAELEKLLTDAQKKKLKTLEGKPFKRKAPEGGSTGAGPGG